MTRRRDAGRPGAEALVRNCHIFAAAVREILEEEILRKLAPGLTLSQLYVLRLITLNGLRQIREAALFLGVSPASATQNIDRLEKFGLVRRNHSPQDRREIFISATARGRELVRRYEAVKAGRLAGVLDHFQPDEAAQLARLLERFSLLLFKSRPAEHGACLRCAAYIRDGCAVGRIHGGCPYQEARGEEGS